MQPVDRDRFLEQGYLIVKNALSPEHIAAMIEVVDRLHATGRLSPPGGASIAGRINRIAGAVRAKGGTVAKG